MPEFSFADRYAEASLAPSGTIITVRQGSAERIVANIEDNRILDLAGLYYGSPDLELGWLREEFAKDDPSFSLVNNEREARVLATAMLGALVQSGNSVAILALVAGGVAGNRVPVVAHSLQGEAADALKRSAVAARRPGKLETKLAPITTPKLADEVSALVQNDWTTLVVLLGKIRGEANSAVKNLATQASAALAELSRQLRYGQEETQILWWLTGGYSRSLERSFSTLGPQQAGLVGGVDLGDLTTVSRLGPVAAPAILDRVIAMARKPRGIVARDLASAVDGVALDDLQQLRVFPDKVPPWIGPVTAAIALARDMGAGAWHNRFFDRTGLNSTVQFDPLALAEQVYLEHLLGQIL